jgi:competence protein ComEA
VGEISRPPFEATHPLVTRLRQLRDDRRVGVALLACLAVAGAVTWLRTGTAPSVAPPPAPLRARSSEPVFATTTTAAGLIVDVVGAVRAPGVVRLAAGARVIDAIAAAGGAAKNADLTRLNLAAPLADGARVAVPEIGKPAPSIDPSAISGGPASAGDPAPDAPVNLNTATAAQLDALPGVGPATAAAIVRDREAHGPFRTVDDLARVRGIGPAKLDQLRNLVTV